MGLFLTLSSTNPTKVKTSIVLTIIPSCFDIIAKFIFATIESSIFAQMWKPLE